MSIEPFESAAPRLFTVAYRVGGFAEAWVTRTATNLCFDHHRRTRRRARSVADPAPAPSEDRVDLVRALRRLPARQREAVVLRYLADLDEAGVARAMGCSAGAVKQHLHRAVSSLRSDPLLTDRPGA